MKEDDSSQKWSNLSTSTKFDQGFNGKKIVSKAPSHKSLFIESVIEQLSRLADPDPKRQRKIYSALCRKLRDLRLVKDSYKLEEFSSLRGHYIQAVSTILYQPPIKLPLLTTSRYAFEYEELGRIGAGGYGEVFRARHRLDQMEYAVKKIKVVKKEIDFFMHTIGEVQTLARLNHPNIVQYKAAWLEAVPLIRPQLTQLTDIPNAEVSVDIVFQGSKNENNTGSGSTGSSEELAVIPRKNNLDPKFGVILYYSMHLCEGTLRKWLDQRNEQGSEIDIQQALQIFEQIVQGLAFIHASGVVHHDLTPNNVFISRNCQVQLGDFGLACTLGGVGCPVRTGHKGTQLYAAPEQLRGHCHPQSDMFSLGIILLEVIVPFSTGMERASVLEKAKNGSIPEHVWPPIKELMVEMLAINPSERPDAASVLDRIHSLQQTTSVKISEVSSEEVLADSDSLIPETNISKSFRNDSVHTESTETENFETRSVGKRSRVRRKSKSDSRNILDGQKLETEKKSTSEVPEYDNTVANLRKLGEDNSETITELRRQLAERDNEIQVLRRRLSRFSESDKYLEENLEVKP